MNLSLHNLRTCAFDPADPSAWKPFLLSYFFSTCLLPVYHQVLLKGCLLREASPDYPQAKLANLLLPPLAPRTLCVGHNDSTHHIILFILMSPLLTYSSHHHLYHSRYRVSEAHLGPGTGPFNTLCSLISRQSGHWQGLFWAPASFLLPTNTLISSLPAAMYSLRECELRCLSLSHGWSIDVWTGEMAKAERSQKAQCQTIGRYFQLLGPRS